MCIIYTTVYYGRGSDLCATIVQFYCTYSLYYLVLCFSLNLCVAYLYYFSSLTQIICTLAAPTQLVAATTSSRPPHLKIQWWHSLGNC